MDSNADQPESRQEAAVRRDHQAELLHANVATHSHAHSGLNAFGLNAPLLLRNGYSPVPIEPGEKRPLGAIADWNRLRVTPLTADEIADIAKKHPHAGLGVVG